VTRARQHVADGRHAAVNSADQRRLLAAFLAAVQNGALTALESLLSSGASARNPPSLRTRISCRLRLRPLRYRHVR
jgi:hypothetical protein